ncbi:hypothetical protein PTSG_09543 [Salpingoeca rosetta]|uniref:Uncharacterized protein n=1 Tax=Salpingoeca rosetta (strain ATCC 50818 / BSB-021) TaxID=946362 RepID=F2ULA9_SALR5|nr:uncharacterized protein PTSG_09543 [Salpingoeca rosetta]EGD77908.1 hypothetical protein PTSG_09543 [Salpingoeca rosetta]|eukprot:XP_004989972.1 hypothetical protein PTSG_09543 [Salpingoeca rosetta]
MERRTALTVLLAAIAGLGLVLGGAELATAAPDGCNACREVASEDPTPGLYLSLDYNPNDNSTFHEDTGIWNINGNSSKILIESEVHNYVIVSYRLTFPAGCCTASHASVELYAQETYQGSFMRLNGATNVPISPDMTLELPACNNAPLQSWMTYALHVRPEGGGTLTVSDIQLIRQTCNRTSGGDVFGVIPHRVDESSDITIYGDSINMYHNLVAVYPPSAGITGASVKSSTSGKAVVSIHPYLNNFETLADVKFVLTSSLGFASPITIENAVRVGPFPAITFITPSFVSPPEQATVGGSGFYGSSGGVRAVLTLDNGQLSLPSKYELQVDFANDTMVTFTVGAGVPNGAYLLTISNADGDTATINAFIVAGAPVITAVQPPQGRPSDLVTIIGRNLNMVSDVDFATDGLEVTSSNATHIIARLPQSPAATRANITVSTFSGSALYSYPLLVVTQITPSAPVPGQLANIHISNIESQPASFVDRVTVDGAIAPITGFANGAITIDMPSQFLNSTGIAVILADGRTIQASLGVGVLFHTMTPRVGVPAMEVTFKGQFDGLDLNPYSITLAGTQVGSVKKSTPTEIVVAADAYKGNTPPNGGVSVIIQPDTVALPQFSFTYVTPAITAISAPVTWEGHILTLYGVNLIAPSEPSILYGVALDNFEKYPMTILAASDTQMVVRTPADVTPNPQPAQLRLVWSDTLATVAIGPTIIPTPQITGLASATALPSQVVVLLAEDIPLGYGFQGAVYIAGTQAVVLDITTTNITAIVPPTARSTDNADGSGAVDLEVYVDNSPVQVQGSAALSLYAPVQITEVTPITVSEGVRVTLTGQSFVAGGVDATSVTVDGVDAVVESVTETAIVLRMPALASRVGTRADVVFSVRATALYGSPRVQVTRSVRVISSGGITEVVPAKWKAGDVVRISAQRGTALSTLVDIGASVVSRVLFGETELPVVRVGNGAIVVQPGAAGNALAAGDPLAIELVNGAYVRVASTTCRCEASVIGGVSWPGVIGCTVPSRTSCRGPGVLPNRFAYRYCTLRDVFSATVNTTECVNQKLRDLTTRTISTDTVNSVLEELTNITQHAPLFAPDDVGNAYSIITNATGLLRTKKLGRRTFQLIFRGASDLMAVDGSVLEQSARTRGTPVSRIPSIVERWTDGLVDVLLDDQASVQVEENIIFLAYRFGSARAAFKGSANQVNSSCAGCSVQEAGGGNMPLLVSSPVNYSISSTDVQGVSVTLFRDSRLFAGGQVSNPVRNSTTEAASLLNQTFVDSPVISIQTRRLDGVPFEGEVEFSLPVGYLDNNTAGERVCSFWRVPRASGESAGWSDVGCQPVSIKDGFLTCRCNHLTNFAILANFGGGGSTSSTDKKALSFITYIGVGVSVFCMVLTVGVYLWYKRLREDLGRIIVMHLCVTLTISLLCFAFGIEETSHTDTCTAIAIVLHYFLLSAFAWMVVEGYHLYSTFVVVFHGSHRSDRRQHVRFAAFAYGVPALIVLATGLVIGEEGYGYEDACWLPTKNYEIWAFLGPMCLAILVNIVFFVRIMRSILSVSVANADKATRQRFIRGVRASASFLSIMGVTWVFGALLFSGAVAVQYLFTIFNVFQGLFIFIFHCVWNASVRDAVSGKTRRDTVAYMRTQSTKMLAQGRRSTTFESQVRRGSALASSLQSLGGTTPLNTLSSADDTGGYLDVFESKLGEDSSDDERNDGGSASDSAFTSSRALNLAGPSFHTTNAVTDSDLEDDDTKALQ